MPLEFVTGDVKSGVTGEIKAALFASCSCEIPPTSVLQGQPTVFLVFQPEGVDHIHLQCPLCDEVYCHGGCEQAASQENQDG